MVTESRQEAGRPLAEVEFPSPEITECPYPFFERLRGEAPVFLWPGHDNEYLVSRWDDIAYITAHPELFTKQPPDGRPRTNVYFAPPADQDGCAASFGYTDASVAGSDGREHRMKRNFTHPVIAQDHLQRYEPRIREITNELIDAFIDAGECEFMAQFAGPLPIYVISEVIGFPRWDGPQLYQWTGAGAGGSARFFSPEDQARHAEGQRKVREYAARELQARFERPRDDFLTELVQAQVARDGGKLNLAYLTNETATMLHAGNSTTAHMLASAMMLLLQHPEEVQRVRTDRSLIPLIVEETLRLETPVQFTNRYASRDVQLGDVVIPAGAQVHLLWGAGNRDPEKFEDAGEFHLDRPRVAREHLGFGRGIHVCLGAPLARLEGRIAFETLFDRLAEIRPAPGKNDFKHLELANKRAPQRVYIEFTPAGARRQAVAGRRRS